MIAHVSETQTEIVPFNQDLCIKKINSSIRNVSLLFLWPWLIHLRQEQNLVSIIISAIAETHKNAGNDAFLQSDFIKAINLYTEGIEEKCKDEDLNAKLYSNRASAHYHLGKVITFTLRHFWTLGYLSGEIVKPVSKADSGESYLIVRQQLKSELLKTVCLFGALIGSIHAYILFSQFMVLCVRKDFVKQSILFLWVA